MTRHEIWQAPLSETFGGIFTSPKLVPEPPFSIEDLYVRIWRSGLPAHLALAQLFSLWTSAPSPDQPVRWGGVGVEHWARFHLARYGLFAEMTPEEIQNWLVGKSPWLTRSSLPYEYFLGRAIDELPRFRPSQTSRVITPYVTLESIVHVMARTPDGERAARISRDVRELFDREYQPWLTFLGDWSSQPSSALYGRQVEARELSFLWNASLQMFVSKKESVDVAKARALGIFTLADFARWLSETAESRLLIRQHSFSSNAWREWWRPLRFMGITSAPNRETIEIFSKRFPSCEAQVKNASH